MKNADFSTIPDAPTQLKEIKLVKAGDALPEHCDVRGYIWPSIGIQLLLPVKGWNGKLLEVGCGGFCGSIGIRQCDDPLHRGYACVASDQGNQSTGGDGKWAYHNLQSEIDYGYRSAHVTALSAKVIVERYYSMAAKRSYFVGCSGGGRQGAVEAQRFPLDFDGIVAMEPSLNLSEIILAGLWNGLAVRAPDGSPLFSQQDVETLHQAIVEKCDLNDGIKDGLIGDPRSCRFDPEMLACKMNGKAACLTSAQIEAARKVYAGPTSSTGKKITGRGAMLGSEVDGSWGISSYLAGAKNPGVLSFSAEFFRYMGFMPDPGPNWEAKHFNFDRDYERLGLMDFIYGATNPDLRRYKARGGKLILIQGLHDSGAPNAYGSIDYYETVQRAMGGATATQDFFRLFLVPGRNHCGGGDGAWAIDHLMYLEAWVEQGVAPDSLIAAHPKASAISGVHSLSLRYPLSPETLEFTRPVYPYPAYAYYQGAGDPTDAANFDSRTP